MEPSLTPFPSVTYLGLDKIVILYIIVLWSLWQFLVRPEGIAELSDVKLSVGLSPLECAVPRFRALSALECAVTRTPSCNSFRMRSYRKRWGVQGPLSPKSLPSLPHACMLTARNCKFVSLLSTTCRMLLPQLLCSQAFALLPEGVWVPPSGTQARKLWRDSSF